MKFYIKILAYLLILIFALQSCANFKLNYSKDVENWNTNVPPSIVDLRHTVYLIGDTGNAKKDKTIPIFKFLKNELDQCSEDNSIIFLGDNIYPVGVPPKSKEEDRSLAEHKINVQLDILENFKGNIMFIPGNHDWSKYGLKGIKRQEKYIEKKLNKSLNGITDNDSKDWEDYFLPGNGCGDPQIVEINDQLVIVLIDSEWWLRDWDADQSMNQGCEIKTRADFYRSFENVVRKYRNRNVIVAMHHPLYSNGQHGGHYTLDNHIFPLRFLNKGLYVPMPGLGSAIAFFRGAVGVPQDLANAKYSEMRKDIMAAIGKNGSYILASGHEHTLQYIQKEKQHFIISGSGSKENAASLSSGGEFSYGRLGYSKIDFYDDGSAWLYFYALSDDKSEMQEVFRKKIKDKLQISRSNVPKSFPEYEKNDLTKTRKPTNFEFNKVGGLHKAILGKHYSNIYLKEYPFEVLDLSTYRGGMTPLKRGGGNQTNSLRLLDSNGKQFSMRALTKDASRTLPYPINQMSNAKNILQDNFMAAYPFAASMVPDMAKAAGIYHTNPRLFYVPKQPALDFHNDLFGGDVYLIEERPGGNWSDLESFGNSEKIISTLDVIQKITKNRKHRVDQNWVVRSRLFDMLIKDWDRHEDQWRWATFEDERGKYYRPIPRDRDQPFAKYDGVLSWVIYAINPFMRQLQTYSPDIKNIKWQSWNATYFDQTFTGEMDWPDWEREAKYIQEHVTDEIIEAGFSRIPDAAKDEDWKQMLEDTKKRRDNLVKFARMAYNLKSKVVDILGTDEKDLFEVTRLNDEQTKVEVFRLSKKGKKKESVYNRTFDHDITKEVHLYGLSEDDEFKVTGSVKKSLKIRIIGGVGKDKVVEESIVSQGGKKTLVYDSSTEKNKVDFGKEAKDKTSERVLKNTYDRRSFHYNPNYWMPLPMLGFNPDDGLIAGLDLTYYYNQFKKNPYGQKHHFSADYSFGTQAVNFNYNAEFVQALGNWDLLTDVLLRRNRYAFNFFGLGNDTQNPQVDNIDFNRVRQSKIYLDLLASKRFASDNGSFSIGPFIERTKIENTPNKFVSNLDETLDPTIFRQRLYSGLKAQLSFQSLDQNVNPHKGLKFHLKYDIETNLDNDDFTFGKLDLGMTLYQPLDKNENFIIATQAGLKTIKGEYDFFKAPTIGGISNMRGYRAQRFRGKTVFSHSTDIRFKVVNSVNNFLPFKFGLHGGFDYGRVWESGVDSDKVHISYGGGLWMDPVDFLVISVGQYWSEEDSRFIFKLSHMF